MSHDDKYLIAGDYNSYVHIYSTEEQKEVIKFNPNIGDMAYDLCAT
jgi:hypothetical protein